MRPGKMRKAREASRRARAAEAVARRLSGYARRHGGRFILFGSAASGRMRHDIDILTDFPDDRALEAFLFAECACAE